MSNRLLAATAMTLLLTTEAGASPVDAPVDPPSAPPIGSEQESATRGQVVETINVSNYTYVRVNTGDREIWAAAPAFQVQVGDTVVLGEGLPMINFYSSALKRTFERIYFVGEVRVVDAKGATSPPSTGQPAPTNDAAAEPDLPTPERPEGGSTVEELYAQKAALAGKQILIRAHVVKVTLQVMGRNWIHLRDGTGKGATRDLTVTTAAAASVGDTVLVRGILNVDRDFGYGYRYELLVEDAEVIVE